MRGIRYLRAIDGRYHFSPSPAMRRAGFSNKALGTDFTAAVAYMKIQAEEWEEIRKQIAEAPTIETRGDFHWLIRQFQTDPTWYGSRAPRTQEEMDYAFCLIEQQFGPHPVRIVEPKHARAFYNTLRQEGSVHKARKIVKWFRRLMKYAVHIGVRDTNPAADMEMETPEGRSQVWEPAEVDGFIEAAMVGGVAGSGNIIPPRPSLALAVQLAYDTSLPEQDILALQWSQFDGEGLTVRQLKRRGDRELWIPLHPRTLEMLAATSKTSTYVVVSEETGRPYVRYQAFSRIFRKFRERAGIRQDLTFQDLRRTAMTEMGDHGATNAEIVAFSGHKENSRVLDTYIKPGRAAARNAARKRWGMGNGG